MKVIESNSNANGKRVKVCDDLTEAMKHGIKQYPGTTK
jgi:hypothetical protein